VIAECSRCGSQAFDEDDGSIPHFADADTARASLTGDYQWQLTTGPDAPMWLCRRCAEQDACARLGHDPLVSPAAVLEDGTVLGEISYCDRCGTVLSHTQRTPAPPGYPAPGHRRAGLYWDAAAFPAGQGLADAAAAVIGTLNAAVVTSRWDAWPGDQARRPRLNPPSPFDSTAAARLLITAARQVLAGNGSPDEQAGLTGTET
jgi:hypothetical protein